MDSNPESCRSKQARYQLSHPNRRAFPKFYARHLGSKSLVPLNSVQTFWGYFLSLGKQTVFNYFYCVRHGKQLCNIFAQKYQVRFIDRRTKLKIMKLIVLILTFSDGRLRHSRHPAKGKREKKTVYKFSVTDPDPGSGAFLTP